MKKQLILSLTLLSITLEAGPKNQKKGGGQKLPPPIVIPERADSDRSATPSPIQPPPPANSSRRFVEEAIDAAPARNDAGVQMTMHRFTTDPRIKSPEMHSAQSSERTTPVVQPPLLPEDNGMQMVGWDLVAKLTQEAENHQTVVQSALSALERLGIFTAMEKAQCLSRYLSQTDLERILKMDTELRLTQHLTTYESDADRGAFMARGLDQAISTQTVDAVNRMLELIQQHDLTHFVPAEHQERASTFLLKRQRKLVTTTLPNTQRTTRTGSFSPRSQANHDLLTAIAQSYLYPASAAAEDNKDNEDDDISAAVTTAKEAQEALVTEMLQQLRKQKLPTITKK